MNKSKIEWCDHTWNPITGCRHNCSYCYAKRMTARFAGDVRLNLMAKKDYSTEPAADNSENVFILDKPMLNETGNTLVYPFGFEPTYHKYRMDYPEKLKMGNNIFVGAMADIFGKWVPGEWIRDVMETCLDNPIHNYLFLTKNPERYTEVGVPAGLENMWYGTTITCDADADRFNYLPAGCNTFVSIEPLMGDIVSKHNVMFRQVDWIIIGAERGRNKNKIVPELQWIKDIVVEADYNSVPVFMKDSLVPIVGEENMRREFPKQLQHSEISPKLKAKLFDGCASCKAHLRKSEMITLLARSKRGEQPKQFGFMCRDCFKEFCKGLGLDIPELIGLAERSCRRTTDENAIHNKAVKIRKMTDEQLVHYVEDRVEKARSEGFNCGKTQAPKHKTVDITGIIEEISSVKGIGATKLADIKAILEKHLEVRTDA